MFRRNITDSFREALGDTPVLLLAGSRQVGKSTFVKEQLSDTHGYYTLDDPTVLSSIRRDPSAFLDGVTSPCVIDEVQRASEFFLPLKKIVDEFRRPGFFVLTGSANVLSLPKISDSLAGRMEVFTLWPLSQGELLGRREDFAKTLFSNDAFVSDGLIPIEDLINMISKGGYPEAVMRDSETRRDKWFASYMLTILEKDIKDLANVDGLLELPNLMQLFASRAGNLVNHSEISRSMGMPQTTIKRYVSLLVKTYLLFFLPAWTKNLSKRVVKSPKAYINDTGLLSHLVGYDAKKYMSDKKFLGHVLENFVVMELKKQSTWSEQSFKMYHYRNHSDNEVDIVLETPDSRVAAIEIKLSANVEGRDFIGIDAFMQETGVHFHRGIVFYMGDKVVPFGTNKFAVPLSCLWSES